MKLFKQSLSIFCFGICLLAIQACDVTKLQDAVDDFKLVVELEPVNTYGTIQVLDAVTEDLVTGDVRVTFLNEEGTPEQHRIIDSYSSRLSEVTVNNGFVNFGIRNELVPSEDEPIEVVVLIERDGYEEKFATLTLVDVGSNLFEVEIIDENNLPEGISSAEQPAGSSSATGTLVDDVEIQSETTPNASMSSGISLSSGVTMRGQNGEPVSGQLSANYRFYDSSKLGVSDFIPQVELANENNKAVLGMSEVFIADQSGNPVTDFEVAAQKVGPTGILETPLAPELNFSFDRDLVPDNIGLQDMVLRYQLVEDETIYTYEFNENTWTEENTGSGNLNFSISLVEVSAFPIVFWVESPQRATVNATVNINNPGNENVQFLAFLESGNNGRQLLQRSLISVGAGATHTIDLPAQHTQFRSVFVGYTTYRCGNRFIPRWCQRPVYQARPFVTYINAYPTPSVISVRLLSTGEIIEYPTHNFLTDGNVVNIDLPGSENVFSNTAINVELRCPVASERVRVTSIPGATVMYRSVGSTRWLRAGNIQWDYRDLALNGATIEFPRVEAGVEYEFRLLYDKQSVQPSETIVFNSEDEVVQRVLALDSSQASSVCD
ncbi:MAG: hypothetical protein LAT57_14065 [Balneolales bacterium]|nr:hypothetical protein [Balneolales bacterium]